MNKREILGKFVLLVMGVQLLAACNSDIDRDFLSDNIDKVQNQNNNNNNNNNGNTDLGTEPEFLYIELKADQKTKVGNEIVCGVSVSDVDDDFLGLRVSLVVLEDPTDIDSEIIDEFQIQEFTEDTVEVSFIATKEMAEYGEAGYKVSCFAQAEDVKENISEAISENQTRVVSKLSCRQISNTNREISHRFEADAADVEAYRICKAISFRAVE